MCGVDEDSIRLVARALSDGRKVTVVVGELVTRSLARENIAASLLNLNRLFGIEQKGQIAALARYANSKGAEKLGMLPRPSQAVMDELTSLWGQFPEAEPKTTDAMLVEARKEEINGMFILGANPMMLYPDRQFAAEGLEKLDFLVVCDLFETDTTELADVVLPVASWAEYSGDYVNLEGRVQTASRAIKPNYEAKPPLEIVNLVAAQIDKPLFESDEQMRSEIDSLLQVDAVEPLPAGFLEVPAVAEAANEEYPIALLICDDSHHTGHLSEKAPSLANFCSDPYLEMSPDLAARYDLKEGDSVRVQSEVGKVIVPARISEHIDNEVVLLPRNFASTPVTSLLMRKRRVDRVRISKVDS